MREQLKDLTKQYDKSENDLKALQSVGQIVGEVLKQLTEEKCRFTCTTSFMLISVMPRKYFSYCEGYQRPKICGRVQKAVGQD